jgi:hypothetical protein
MSAEGVARPRRGRRWLLVLAVVVVIALLAIWLAFPWRYLGGVVVEQARIMAPGEADGSRKPANLATQRRIAVTFSTADDLSAVRADTGAGFIRATLRACADEEASNSEVVTQRAGYLSDYGRVRALGTAAGRHRYRAVFDDRLTRSVDHSFKDAPAIGTPGGLCFSLDGGGMWLGKIWSDRTALRIAAGAPGQP